MFKSLLDGRRMFFRLQDIGLLLLVLVMLGAVGRSAVADDKVTGIIPGTNYQATSMDEWHYAKVLLGKRETRLKRWEGPIRYQLISSVPSMIQHAEQAFDYYAKELPLDIQKHDSRDARPPNLVIYMEETFSIRFGDKDLYDLLHFGGEERVAFMDRIIGYSGKDVVSTNTFATNDQFQITRHAFFITPSMIYKGEPKDLIWKTVGRALFPAAKSSLITPSIFNLDPSVFDYEPVPESTLPVGAIPENDLKFLREIYAPHHQAGDLLDTDFLRKILKATLSP